MRRQRAQSWIAEDDFVSVLGRRVTIVRCLHIKAQRPPNAWQAANETADDLRRFRFAFGALFCEVWRTAFKILLISKRAADLIRQSSADFIKH